MKCMKNASYKKYLRERSSLTFDPHECIQKIGKQNLSEITELKVCAVNRQLNF